MGGEAPARYENGHPSGMHSWAPGESLKPRAVLPPDVEARGTP
jgi:hypothetical protein